MRAAFARVGVAEGVTSLSRRIPALPEHRTSHTTLDHYPKLARTAQLGFFETPRPST